MPHVLVSWAYDTAVTLVMHGAHLGSGSALFDRDTSFCYRFLSCLTFRTAVYLNTYIYLPDHMLSSATFSRTSCLSKQANIYIRPTYLYHISPIRLPSISTTITNYQYSTTMSSTSSIHSIFSDDELPTYEESSLPPNVTIEEREISSDDEDDDDDYYHEQPEPKNTIKQSTKTYTSLKSFFYSGTVAPSAEFQKSTITFDQTAAPTRPKTDRKPSFKREYTLVALKQFYQVLIIQS